MSTGQPHEGSSYASQKVLQMAWHRLEHARSRVAELDRSVMAMSTQRNFAEHNIRISAEYNITIQYNIIMIIFLFLHYFNRFVF